MEHRIEAYFVIKGLGLAGDIFYQTTILFFKYRTKKTLAPSAPIRFKLLNDFPLRVLMNFCDRREAFSATKEPFFLWCQHPGGATTGYGQSIKKSSTTAKGDAANLLIIEFANLLINLPNSSSWKDTRVSVGSYSSHYMMMSRDLGCASARPGSRDINHRQKINNLLNKNTRIYGWGLIWPHSSTSAISCDIVHYRYLVLKVLMFLFNFRMSAF